MAVRSEVASLLVSKPLQLLGILALYAGIEEGVLRPFFEDEQFGPNSIMYMSREVFYSGFVVSTILDIMANTWYKIQVNSRLDDLGGFNKVPTKLDQTRGFWRYYFKNYANPANSWWASQLFMMKLVWANIPAAVITMSVSMLLTHQRIDIGILFAGFVLYFITPMAGINEKIEQSFELASTWVNSRIPKKLRAHKKAHEYINMEIQKRKFIFTFFHTLYETTFAQLRSIFTLLTTEEYGSRSMLRLMFGGYTPTELAALGLRKTGEVLGFIPGVEFITEKCEDLLTNNYTDWEKVSPRGDK